MNLMTRPAQTKRVRNIRRILFRLLLAFIVGFFVICWIASSRLICPSRRPLQDYHREIIANAVEHGMVIRPFMVETGPWKGTPCLVCEPSNHPGAAAKGNLLRKQLETEGVVLKPWGRIISSVVLLHGHTGRKEDHLPVAERLCAVGFRCILPDLPGHGDHPSPHASFGFRESTLPSAALEATALAMKFDSQPACLMGISQGGAIALQAAAADQTKWAAVAELSSFADLEGVIANQARRIFGPLHAPARFLVGHLVQWRAGYDPVFVRPVDAAAKLDSIPVFIGHGDIDTFVPPDHAKRLLEATHTGTKQFLSIHGAGHHDVLVTPQPVYATISKFLVDALQKSERTKQVSPTDPQ
jgi:pimeloyl-ACP methyl ester carboxylesterase